MSELVPVDPQHMQVERLAGRFRPGQSGNPRGRLPGTRNRATTAALALLDGEAEALARKAVAMALAGNETMLKLCLDRILPRQRPLPVELETPEAMIGRLDAIARGAHEIGGHGAAIAAMRLRAELQGVLRGGLASTADQGPLELEEAREVLEQAAEVLGLRLVPAAEA